MTGLFVVVTGLPVRAKTALARGLAVALLAWMPITALAGCAWLRPPDAARPSSRIAETGTADGNKAAAQDEADRLIALVAVPPDAVPVGAEQAVQAGPVVGRPSVDSLVDLTRVWRVEQPFDQVIGWVRTHRPAGLTASSGARGGSGLDRFEGDGYRVPDTASWIDGELQVGVVAVSATRSQIRADALVTWLDPEPLPDDQPGSRRHITVTAGCPASVAALVGVTNSGPELALRMVPDGTPSAGLVCRYGGLGRPPAALVAATHLSADAAWALAIRVNQVRLAHPVGQTTSCPADLGAVTLIALSYPGYPGHPERDVDLWLTGGCAQIANGVISAAGSVDVAAPG